MRVVPKDNLGVVQFYEVHAPVWQAEAGSIGLTPAEADGVADAAAAARAALDRQYAAQEAARAATRAYENALDRLRACGSACIARIRVAATAAGDGGGEGGNGVYERAQLPMPARPGRLPDPGKPSRITATLDPTGPLRLRWRCKNPTGSAGTMYEVYRRDATQGGEFAFIGMAGGKTFVDDTIQPGTVAVLYRVTAVRAARRGAPELCFVRFSAGQARAA